MSYLVVLRGKPDTKQPGVCTFTSFNSKAHFIEQLSSILEYNDIAAVGIDADAAEAVCAAVPAERLFNSALLQCINADGSFSLEAFRFETLQIQILRDETCPPEILQKAASYANQSLHDPRAEGSRFKSCP